MNSQTPHTRKTASPTKLTLRALESFHALVAAANVDQLMMTIPAPLQGTDFNAPMEAAWALLYAITTMPIDDPDEAISDDADLEALLRMMPPYRRWLDYLGRFPAGDEVAAYRKERQTFVMRRYFHIHPNRRMLDEYAAGSKLAAIAAHTNGPHYCVPCRKTIEMAMGTTNESKLAAHTPDEPALTIPIAAREQSFVVSCIDDAGYLRVFLEPDTSAADSTAQFDVTILCESGKVLNGIVEYPQHSLAGANFGKLGPRGMGDVIGLDIEERLIVRE